MCTREEIEKKIREIVASPQNSLKLLDEPAFDAPLVGFGAGGDGLLDFFRADIGDFYVLPDEWLRRKYGRAFDRKEISLVSWALPQTEKTRAANRAQTERPALAWALNRNFGEAFQRGMAKQLEDWLDGMGIPAVAPMARDDFSWEHSEKYGYASNWSERHTAYLCGLGTFGLCDGLITARGKAMRFGSVIVALPLSPDPRPYTRYNEYCLAQSGCAACAARCPAGAITPEGGHDKDRCAAYQKAHIVDWCREHYGYEGSYGCGLCQTGVPCERGIPARTAKEK